jgi:hypothetical protein
MSAKKVVGVLLGASALGYGGYFAVQQQEINKIDKEVRTCPGDATCVMKHGAVPCLITLELGTSQTWT